MRVENIIEIFKGIIVQFLNNTHEMNSKLEAMCIYLKDSM
jgi:hypothetical protein